MSADPRMYYIYIYIYILYDKHVSVQIPKSKVLVLGRPATDTGICVEIIRKMNVLMRPNKMEWSDDLKSTVISIKTNHLFSLNKIMTHVIATNLTNNMV